MLEQLELTQAKSLSSPGVEETTDGKAGERTEESKCPSLPDEQASLYRAITARANYIAQDRADIQYAVKELCRRMSDPDENCFNRLKRLGRYLRGKPRAVSRFPWQTCPGTQDVFSDANWAGCRASRKSTSGGAIQLGAHTIRTWSKTQNTIAQSSAESELLAIVRAATEALGCMSLALDLGLTFDTRMHVDASAALGILERKGVGKIRHLDVGTLWLQEVQLRQKVAFMKIKGTSNPADLMTKHLAQDQINEYAEKLGYEFRVGRSDATAKLHSITPSKNSTYNPHARESIAKSRRLIVTEKNAPRELAQSGRRDPEATSTAAGGAGELIHRGRGGAGPRELPVREARVHASGKEAISVPGCPQSQIRKAADRISDSKILRQGYGWMQVGHDKWQGRFRGARAHRLPPEVPWRQILSRTTVDENTNEVLEMNANMTELMTIQDATRKLDKVRDIECTVMIEYVGDKGEKDKQVAAEGCERQRVREAMDRRRGVQEGGRNPRVEDHTASNCAEDWGRIPKGQKWADAE